MPDPASVRFAVLVARWAQRQHLPPGNYWEPALLRHMEARAASLGGDASAYAFVEAMTARELGMKLEDARG